MKITSRTRRVCLRHVLFGAVTGALLGLTFSGTPCSAQDSHTDKWKVTLAAADTSIQHDVYKDTTDFAGRVGVHLYRVDSLTTEHLVYVPRSCDSGICPLLVYLPGGGLPATNGIGNMRGPAEKYGFIVLAMGNSDFDQEEARRDFAIALRQTVRTFSIDRTRIAIVGNCQSGGSALLFGINNLDIFSRIANVSSTKDSVMFADLPPQSTVNHSIEFFLDDQVPYTSFKQTAALEKRGYRVKHRVGWREHAGGPVTFDALGQWLMESWSFPNPTDRVAPIVLPGPLPVLTTKALAQMTNFWTQFLKLPPVIEGTARETYRREVAIPIGEQHVLMTMADIPTVAAKYPPVAAALKSAGLTAQQHEAYRVAIATALLDAKMLENAADIQELRKHPPPNRNGYMIPWGIDLIANFAIPGSSTQGKNMAFLAAHSEERNALLLYTKMTTTP